MTGHGFEVGETQVPLGRSKHRKREIAGRRTKEASSAASSMRRRECQGFCFCLCFSGLLWGGTDVLRTLRAVGWTGRCLWSDHADSGSDQDTRPPRALRGM